MEAKVLDDPRAGAAPLCFDRFILGETLGAGAVGQVHRALDPEGDREVALKVVALPLAALAPERRAALAARLTREARIAGSLDHPGIVRVLDAGEADGAPWLAMELVRGQSFGAWLRGHRGAPRFLERAVELLRQASEAVAAAHAAGVVHRDVKPDNILVEAAGASSGERGVAADEPAGERARVTDFGLAFELAQGSRLTASGDAIGTPPYMSPEQARGDVAAMDARTDVYGLGATLYEILTGRPPYDEGAPWRTALAVLRGDPPLRAPSEVAPPGWPPIPAALEALAMRALARDPALRPASAAAFAAALAAWLGAERADPGRHGGAGAAGDGLERSGADAGSRGGQPSLGRRLATDRQRLMGWLALAALGSAGVAAAMLAARATSRDRPPRWNSAYYDRATWER